MVLVVVCLGQNDENLACIYPKNNPSLLPELFLETQGQINFVKRVDATWTNGTQQGKCAIEFHGNSTRKAAKRSYDLEFKSEIGGDVSKQILGLPNTESIVLLANVFDPTMLRNALAFDVWSHLDHTAAGYSFCQVYLNGEYQGLYLATEKIRKINRLIDPNACTSNPDLLRKPFLLKIDWENEGAVQIQGVTDWPFKGKVLDPKPFTDKWIGYDPELENYFKIINRSLNTILQTTKDSLPYSHYIDVTSFVDYFLVSELSKNPDAYHSSLFLFSGDAGKLTVGPIWDFDLAFANALNPEDDAVEGWIYKKELPYNELRTTPTWWYLLLCDPNFRMLCMERLSLLDKWIRSAEFQMQLDNHMEQVRKAMNDDNTRWNKKNERIGLGPIYLTAEQELTAIHQFLLDRIAWMQATLPEEPCLSPFEVAARQDEYDLLEEDPGKKQFTVKFPYYLSSNQVYPGTRYAYQTGYSYILKNSYGVQIQAGPVSGSELIIKSSTLPRGDYYLVVSEHPEDQLIATSAPRTPIVYRKKLHVK